MKKSDIYICGFMYAFSFFFLYLTQSFPLGARHYPHFVIGLLLLLTTVRVGQMVRDYRREKASENDMPVLFDGFMPKQFWTMFAAFILYFVMMYLVGFYSASLVLPALLSEILQDPSALHSAGPRRYGGAGIRYL